MKKKLLFTILIVSAGLLFFVFSNKVLFTYGNDKPNSKHYESEKKSETMDELISLPKPVYSGEMSVEEALLKRRSVRSYKDYKLSLQQVSQLLWAAYGISGELYGRKLKTAPSAGATYPLELYLMAGNVDGLTSGLYKYNSEEHSLSLHLKSDIRSEVASACHGQKMLQEAPASIIFNAVYSRTTSRYGERGSERYVCMDLGHSAQNVYLQATAMGLATCAIGAFNDSKLKNIIKPVKEEVVLYLMPVGYEDK